jgi:anti-sigma B factor antagonist
MRELRRSISSAAGPLFQGGAFMPTPTTSSPLSLDIERKDDLVTIKCHGRLIYNGTELLTKRVKEQIPGSKRIILDLTDLTHMDSMGIGTVVRLYVSAKTAGSNLQLINLAPRIRQILGITNLLSILCEMCEQGISVRF